jgi:hypothetical protein
MRKGVGFQVSGKLLLAFASTVVLHLEPITKYFLISRPLTYFQMGPPLRWDEKVGLLISTKLLQASPEQSFLILHPIGTHDQTFVHFKTTCVFSNGVSSSMREGVGLSVPGEVLLAFASRVILGSTPCKIHDHSFLPHNSRSRAPTSVCWSGNLLLALSAESNSVLGPAGTHDHMFVLFKPFPILIRGFFSEERTGLTTTGHAPSTESDSRSNSITGSPCRTCAHARTHTHRVCHMLGKEV